MAKRSKRNRQQKPGRREAAVFRPMHHIVSLGTSALSRQVLTYVDLASALTSGNDWSYIINLYKRFRVLSVELRFCPLDGYRAGTGASTPCYPVVAAYNPNVVVAPGAVNQVFDIEGATVWDQFDTKPWVMKFKPRFDDTYIGEDGFCDITNTFKFGSVQVASDGMMTGANQAAISVFATFHCEFKHYA